MLHRIVVIDDEPSICKSLKFALAKQYEVTTFTDPDKALDYLAENQVSVVLLDLRIGSKDGLVVLPEIKRINSNIAVIIMTAYGSIKSSVEAVKNGAFYYITKPVDLPDLHTLIQRAVELVELQTRVNFLDLELNKKYQTHGIIGKSKATLDVLNIVERVKDIDSNVLIQGESGTGKELVARAIHFSGKRGKSPFIAINCAAIPSSLLESELFGYEQGAFTGAIKTKRGKFELADGGSLFLDEIGDMDLALQAKLLRVLQEKVITPLGSETARKINVRIIAATNKNLLEEVVNDNFREDLYYRLNVIGIHLPPLRERKEDLPLLINHFLNKHCALHDRSVQMSNDVMEKLLNQDYRGNIRELENVIERLVVFTEGNIIENFELSKNCLDVYEQKASKKESFIPVSFGETIEEVEMKLIIATLEKVGGKQKEAAKILGVTDRTLRNKFKKL
jgi:DNA-binding NtrC family response regulator